jgi:hypothetical protein
MASPRGTEHLGEKLRVLAKTIVPSASKMHIPIPVLLRELEKEASTLHFSLSGGGRRHTVSDEETNLRVGAVTGA